MGTEGSVGKPEKAVTLSLFIGLFIGKKKHIFFGLVDI